MTKNIAIFPRGTVADLLHALNECGYSLEQPGTGEIRSWDATGESAVLASADTAVAFLRDERGGIQLWKTESDDLFVSVSDSQPRLSFDGLTGAEEAALILALRNRRFIFRVVDEDEEESLSQEHR